MDRWIQVLAAGLGIGVAIRCGVLARGSAGAPRAVWTALAGGAGLTWLGPVLGGAWMLPPYLALASFYLTAYLRPHRQPPGPARPALLLDAVLVALLLVAVHPYWAASGRLATAAAPALLLGLGAAVVLGACRRAAGSPAWRRCYALLAAAALCQSLGVALASGSAVLATAAQMAACAAVALASRDFRPGSCSQAAEPVAVSWWRDLAAPVGVLVGLLGLPALDRLFSAAGPRSPPLVVAQGVYIALVLIRLLLVQLENRSLASTLQQESTRLRLLVDNLHDAVVIEDLAGRIIFASDRFLDLFGLGGRSALGLALGDYIHPEDRPLRPQVAEGGNVFSPGRFEFRGLRADGAVLYLESSVAPVRLGGPAGMVLGLQSVIRDITERRRAEEQQRELVQRLEFFVDHMPLGCIVWDLEFRIVEWNNTAAQIFGWSATEVFGRPGLPLVAVEEDWPGVRSAWEELQQTKSSNHRLTRNLTRDGGSIECEWFNTSLIDQAGRVVGVASMVLDVTDKKNLEEQLRHSQKMEAVGVLAGGIAHDFNNLLTVILGNVSLARLRLPPSSPALRGLRDAEKAAERASELVRQLLDFSRKGRSSPGPVSLNASVRETVDLLRHTLDPGIAIDVREDPQLWLASADPGQVHQVLVNLCVNARDAMLHGGRLSLATANRLLDEKYSRAHPEARPGEFVMCSVSDTGTGIAPETLGRIFEPFFTTKEVGKGTGLGLAMVYGIVSQHQGWVSVDSAPGRGSTFSVFLPRSKVGRTPEITAPAASAEAVIGTILLVDDEELILALGRSILESAGHRVLEARDGEQALDVFRRFRPDIDLVVLDVVMPRRSGRDVLRELHNIAPEVPVVLTSGYSWEGPEEVSVLGARRFIQKPYKPDQLHAVIADLLGAKVPLPV